MCRCFAPWTHRNALYALRQWMQKFKFGVTCADTLFIETTVGPPKHEKLCINVSCPGLTRMHYVTRRLHRVQKHKFDVTCPIIFCENHTGPTQA
jgi:hypothetical protein